MSLPPSLQNEPLGSSDRSGMGVRGHRSREARLGGPSSTTGPAAMGRAFSVGAESLVRAEAVRPFPVVVKEVRVAQPADGDRDMEVSELPCSTGELASSVEPVREIAMAESLVVTRPRRVKDGITGIRLWLEIQDVRAYRSPGDVRVIERAVRTGKPS